MQAILKISSPVRASEVNTRMEISLPAICDLLQEAAGQHAKMGGVAYSDLIGKNLAWVLSRLGVKMFRYPKWNEEIIVETWVNGFNRLFSYRNFQLSDSEGNVIGIASTAWLLINVKTKRMQRFDGVMKNFEILEDKQVDITLGKIPKLNNITKSMTTTVKYSHLDMLKHVNNVQYLRWMLDSFDLDFLHENTPKEMHINFLAEAFYGDGLLLQQVQKEDEYLLNIQRGDKEICRASMRF